METFNLLAEENFLSLSNRELDNVTVKDGVNKSITILKLTTNIKHFALKSVLNFIERKRELFRVIYKEDYKLPYTYNLLTKNILINIAPFEVKDITSNKPYIRDLYALYFASIIFYKVAKNRSLISRSLAYPIIDLLSSIFIRVFGKQYGLLTTFLKEVSKLKFLLASYIYAKFFGITNRKDLYSLAKNHSTFTYSDHIDKLSKYDFTNINDFIKSLSDFGVAPGINVHIFSRKLYSFFGINFLAALESLSRFLSFISIASVYGNRIVPTFISTKYNRQAFASLLKTVEFIVKK